MARLPLAAIGLTAWLEVALLRRTGYLPWLQPLVVVAAVVAAGGCSWRSRSPGLSAASGVSIASRALAIAVAGFLVAPAAWSATTLRRR